MSEKWWKKKTFYWNILFEILNLVFDIHKFSWHKPVILLLISILIIYK